MNRHLINIIFAKYMFYFCRSGLRIRFLTYLLSWDPASLQEVDTLSGSGSFTPSLIHPLWTRIFHTLSGSGSFTSSLDLDHSHPLWIWIIHTLCGSWLFTPSVDPDPSNPLWFYTYNILWCAWRGKCDNTGGLRIYLHEYGFGSKLKSSDLTNFMARSFLSTVDLATLRGVKAN